jgi:hypothetical protein
MVAVPVGFLTFVVNSGGGLGFEGEQIDDEINENKNNMIIILVLVSFSCRIMKHQKR